MKELLIALTLLTSMSSFANENKVYADASDTGASTRFFLAFYAKGDAKNETKRKLYNELDHKCVGSLMDFKVTEKNCEQIPDSPTWVQYRCYMKGEATCTTATR